QLCRACANRPVLRRAGSTQGRPSGRESRPYFLEWRQHTLDFTGEIRMNPEIPYMAASQFPAIRAAGYTQVINLAPHGAENALPDERAMVEGLGMRYVHLPVDFSNPTEEDFAAFCAAMSGMSGDERIYVHCAANMRVS